MKKLLSVTLVILMLLSSVSCAAPVVDGNILSSEDVQPLAANTPISTIVASDEAYVQQNKADQNWKNISTDYLLVKNDGGTTRHTLLKFDISNLTLLEEQAVSVVVDVIYVQPIKPAHLATDPNAELRLRVYSESAPWDSTTVTYNSLPALSESNFAGEELITKGEVFINITDCVKAALEKGEKTLSLRLVPNIPTVAEIKLSKIDSKSPPRLVVTDGGTRLMYQYDILADKAQNEALWGYAKKIYDDWKARYDEIVANGDYDTTPIEINKSQYTFTTTASEYSNGFKANTFDTRLVSTLGNFTPRAEIEFDKYGGVISEMRFEPTGYFYTKNVDGRWFVIDPLGYPCLINGINHTYHAYSDSKYQTAAMSRKFGSEEKWAISTTRWLKRDLGFNVAEGALSLLSVANGLPTMRYAKAAGPYASSVGLNTSNGGTTDFLYDAMPVFDPGFATYVSNNVAATVAQHADNEMVLGYFSDNELPVHSDMLVSYLKLDPSNEKLRYSYVCAWTWITEFTGKEASEIKLSKIGALSEELGIDLLELFKGFVYDRYYSVVQPVVKAAAPNQLYLGVRILSGKELGEWHSRFNGYWCDITCINYYGVWEISTEHVAQLESWLGKPFMITEFYAKGNDAIGADGKLLKNTDGAGWICKNQTERGYFYQNFTLRLLEAKNCIGWLYFQYIDNDPTDETIEAGQKNSNKGIVDSDHDREIYSAYTKQIAEINLNKYALIEYFDGVDYFK